MHQKGGFCGKGKSPSCTVVRQRGAAVFTCVTSSWVFAKIFHSRAVLSSDAVTMRVPSGLNAALNIRSSWPLSGSLMGLTVWPIETHAQFDLLSRKSLWPHAPICGKVVQLPKRERHEGEQRACRRATGLRKDLPLGLLPNMEIVHVEKLTPRLRRDKLSILKPKKLVPDYIGDLNAYNDYLFKRKTDVRDTQKQKTAFGSPSQCHLQSP